MAWKTIELGKVASFINGYAFKPKDWGNTGLPIIRIQNLTNTSDRFNYYNGLYNPQYEVKYGDILISWSASLGVFEWQGDQALLNQHIFKVVFDKIDVDKSYFKHVVNQSIYEMKQYTHGSTMKHITKKYFDKINIPLPSLETQQKIADVLDKAQALIDKRKEQLEKLDELVQSVFYDMFGDPVMNPKKWRITKLDEVADIVSGVTKGRKMGTDTTLSVPYMRVANVQDGHLVLTEIKEITVSPNEVKAYHLEHGDLLMTEGGDPDKLGRCAIWRDEIPGCIHQNHIFRVRLDRQILQSEYLCFLAGSPYGKRYFLRAGKQTTGIATINSKQLKNFPVLLPPIDLQNKFAHFVEKTEQQKALMQQSLFDMENNFNSIMQRSFKGELF